MTEQNQDLNQEDKPAEVVGVVDVVAEESPKHDIYISFDDFAKVELRIGKIINAEILEKSDKLLKLAVDFGETENESPKYRQVLSGIRKQFSEPAELVGKCFVFVTNLKPRPIMGLESQAMILAGKSGDTLALMTPNLDLEPGTILS